MYNYRLIDKIELQNNKEVVVFYNSGIKKKIKNIPLWYYLKNKNICDQVCKYDIEFLNEYLTQLKDFYRNKNKLTFEKFNKILENNKNGFYGFHEVVREGKTGIIYHLDKPFKSEIFTPCVFIIQSEVI